MENISTRHGQGAKDIFAPISIEKNFTIAVVPA